MRRLVALGLMILVTSTLACQRQETAQRQLDSALQKSVRQPREFVYTEEFEDTEVKVLGAVEDDLRFRAMLVVDGSEVYEQVVSDDALAIRILDASKLPGRQIETAAVLAGSQVIGDALDSGRWVIDYAGAPPLLAPLTREGGIAVGRNAVLDAYWVFQYFNRAIADSLGAWEWNDEDLLQYNALYTKEFDPFEAPNRDLGIKRFDLIPPPLPGRSARGSEQALPTTAHFRRIAFYVKSGELIRVEEVIDPGIHLDFIRAQRGQGTDFQLELLAGVRQGRTREPLRIRSLVLEISFKDDVQVRLPETDVLTAGLGGIFGPEGVETQPLPGDDSAPGS